MVISLDHGKQLVTFWRPCPNFQGHSSIEARAFSLKTLFLVLQLLFMCSFSFNLFVLFLIKVQFCVIISCNQTFIGCLGKTVFHDWGLSLVFSHFNYFTAIHTAIF